MFRSQHDNYALDRLKIEQIVVTERYCRDTAQWDKMRAFWHSRDEQTNLKITWFNGTIDGHIEGSKAMAQKSGLTGVKHAILPVDVTIHGDRAMCEAYGEIMGRAMLDWIEYDMSSSATFIVKLLRVSGEWKIVSLECVYDRDNLVPIQAQKKLPSEPLAIDFPRESYRGLAYVLQKLGGYKIDENLPGFDRPEQALQLLEKSRNWVKTGWM